MSINKQKYFSFLLFFLINKFIFISGDIQGTKQNIDYTKFKNGVNLRAVDDEENTDSDSSSTNIGEGGSENQSTSNANNNNEQNGNSQDKKYDKYVSCGDVQPTNGIISDCTTNSIDNSRSCCYVTINYEHNEFNFCIQTPKDKDKIENTIDKLEQEYVGCDSVDIDCHSGFINFSFIFLLIVLVF